MLSYQNVVIVKANVCFWSKKLVFKLSIIIKYQLLKLHNVRKISKVLFLTVGAVWVNHILLCQIVGFSFHLFLKPHLWYFQRNVLSILRLHFMTHISKRYQISFSMPCGCWIVLQSFECLCLSFMAFTIYEHLYASYVASENTPAK